jgi:CHAT domain-containing protein
MSVERIPSPGEYAHGTTSSFNGVAMKASLLNLILAVIFLTGATIGDAAQDRGGRGGAKGANRQGLGAKDSSATPSDIEANAQEFEKNKDWSKASAAYRRATNLARMNGEYQKALQYGQKALAMAQAAQDPALQVAAIVQLSFVYTQIRQKEKKKELLEKGVELVKKVPPGMSKQLMEANLYRELGSVYLAQGDTDKAIEYIAYSLQAQESRLALLKRRGQPNSGGFRRTVHNTALSYQRLGKAYTAKGNSAEAIKAYEKSLAIAEEYKLQSGTKEMVQQQLAELYLEQKDFSRARDNAAQALKLAEHRQHAIVIWGASKLMGDLLRQTEGPSAALPYYQRAITVIESSRAGLESEELRIGFFEGKGPVYTGMILAHIEGKNWEEAFNFSERARSRAFLDVLGSKVQLAAGSLLEEERSLQARISGLRARMSAVDQIDADDEATEEDQEQLKEALAAAQQAYSDHLAKVRKANKEQASLMNVEPLTLKEVQEQLDPRETVLEYYVARNQILLWIVEKERINGVVIRVPRRDLVARITALRNRISQPDQPADLKKRSQELYKLLVAPALPHIRGKELIIVPHDVLHYLPFQALLSAQGRYLIEDYPIRFLSSASLMQFTREKRRASRESTLAMGNPSLGDPAYELRFAEREVRELAQIYSKSDVFLREQATKSKAVSLSPTHDVLHFAVHAEFNEEDPMSSALLLAQEGIDDGRLKVGEIFSLNLKADMVVLSACETGLGKNNSGDEIIGLTRAFIYAGTPSVITTLWKVNDRASYELMSVFYSSLKTMKKSEALRHAQLATMKEFPQPFFWAAYGLTGEP